MLLNQYLAGQYAVLVTFDDAMTGLINLGLPLTSLVRARCTVYSVTSWTSLGGAFMDVADLVSLQSAGWMVGNHTQDHEHLTSLSQADAQTQLSSALGSLSGWGLTGGYHVAYPFGEFDETVRAAMTAEGMLTGRMASGGGQFTLLGQDLYTIPAYVVENITSVATVTGWIDAAVAAEDVCCLLFHNLVSGAPGADEYNIDDFMEIIDYIVNNSIPLITMNELYALTLGDVNVQDTGLAYVDSESYEDSESSNISDAVRTTTYTRKTIYTRTDLNYL